LPDNILKGLKYPGPSNSTAAGFLAGLLAAGLVWFGIAPAPAATCHGDTDDANAGDGNAAGTRGASPFGSTSSAGTLAGSNITITTADTVYFGTALLALGPVAASAGLGVPDWLWGNTNLATATRTLLNTGKITNSPLIINDASVSGKYSWFYRFSTP
jgi:hypothetical protein